MINRIFILLAFFTLYSCRNYESKKYITIENDAINDIIRQLINYDYLIKMNDFDTTNIKILLTSSLGTDIVSINEPSRMEWVWTHVNGVKLPDTVIKAKEKRYEEAFKKYRRQESLFAPLQNGKLKKRIFDYQFEYSNLQVELIPECPDKFEELKQSEYYDTFSRWLYSKCSELKENEYGFLYISRIIFNRCFDKGYLSYEFWCGEGCWWTGNIEIIKVNGKWEVSREFSGEIA